MQLEQLAARPVPASRNANAAGSAPCKSTPYRMLHHGLENHVGYERAERVLRDLELDTEAPAKVRSLDIQKGLEGFELLTERDLLRLGTSERNAKQGSELREHSLRGGDVRTNQSRDCRKCVAEEMRVNLRLERAQLRGCAPSTRFRELISESLRRGSEIPIPPGVHEPVRKSPEQHVREQLTEEIRPSGGGPLRIRQRRHPLEPILIDRG